MDAAVLPREEHQTVEKLSKRFEETGDDVLTEVGERLEAAAERAPRARLTVPSVPSVAGK
ncbi:hypothetical protein O1L60_39590 [Streptomyces diastatochromogenes]|nr:hypothetical protein [Streptomyces diastatochromogenes]